MKKFAALFLLLCLFMAPTVHADSVWDSAKSPEYGKKVWGMLGRGVVNVATCFMDLIVQTVEGTQDGPPFIGTMTGLGGGLGCTALRVSSGALDVLTFWVPDFNGMPVARSYSNCLAEDEGNSAAPAEVVPAVAERAPAARTPAATDYVKK